MAENMTGIDSSSWGGSHSLNSVSNPVYLLLVFPKIILASIGSVRGR